eukprot:7012132-Lingulodinium_polyedra.AAC.1
MDSTSGQRHTPASRVCERSVLGRRQRHPGHLCQSASLSGLSRSETGYATKGSPFFCLRMANLHPYAIHED